MAKLILALASQTQRSLEQRRIDQTIHDDLEEVVTEAYNDEFNTELVAGENIEMLTAYHGPDLYQGLDLTVLVAEGDDALDRQAKLIGRISNGIDNYLAGHNLTLDIKVTIATLDHLA